MQQSPLGRHLLKQRRRGIWREDVERRALQPVLLDPRGGLREDLLTVVIEAENEGTIHLNAVVM